jgi:isoleucyl-tRNA synthetase
MPQDKINAYYTLYTTLVTLAKMMAPMVPFMAEDIYTNLVGSVDSEAPVSVHLCAFPAHDASAVDAELEENMDRVLATVILGRSARNASGMKTRQPLAKMYVKADFTLSSFYTDIIAEELNVKEVVFTDSVRAFTSYTFKPQLKTVGPKYGRFLGDIRNQLAAIDGNAAMDELEATGTLKLNCSGTEIALTLEDLMISSAQTEGFASAEDRGVTVVLDTTLTDALIEEGNVREVVSKVQTMRKESGFEVTDHIRLYVWAGAEVEAIVSRNEAIVKDDTLTDEVVYASTEGGKEWNINGKKVTLAVEKL